MLILLHAVCMHYANGHICLECMLVHKYACILSMLTTMELIYKTDLMKWVWLMV